MTFAWQTFASLSLFTCLVYVNTNCVPIAHLRQNKPFPLLYLGHAQITSYITIGSRQNLANAKFMNDKGEYVVLNDVRMADIRLA